MAVYRRHGPETTLLYQVVAEELDQLREALAVASPHGSGLPRNVDKELEAYLRCGILRNGFARVVCGRCRAEHLVAFSCKGRGICPSCTTRRMYDTAAPLVDRVLPRVPMRQWVVTFPRRVRWHLAQDPKLASAALREVLRTLFAFQRRHARRLGVRPARANSNGAVTFVQRFNSALELSLHFHSLIPDGVFVRDDEDDLDAKPRFVEIPPPTDEEVATLLDRIAQRSVVLLRRHGRLEDEVDEEPEPQLVLAACAPAGNRSFIEDPLLPLCARKEGFSLHAGIAVHANDRLGLERLCRYGLRPPLALGRLSERPDGTLVYQMKRKFADGRHILRFRPREFLFRLCALVPPRGFHMVRYAGIFAAHARGRFALTGKGLRDRHAGAGDRQLRSPAKDSRAPPSSVPAATVAARQAADSLVLEAAPRISKEAVPHARRLKWATLLKRAWEVDVLVCSKCDGLMRMIALIEDPRTARKILEHLGLPVRAPPRGRTRRPSRGILPAADFDGIDAPTLD